MWIAEIIIKAYFVVVGFTIIWLLGSVFYEMYKQKMNKKDRFTK